MSLVPATFTTPWGASATLLHRAGRNDYNVLNSCIGHDEYHVGAIGKAGETCIDLGAHIGGFSVAAVLSGMNVIAVEVLPENTEVLTKNLLAVGLSSEHVVGKAIHHTAGEQIIMCTGESDTLSGYVHEFIGKTVHDYDHPDAVRGRMVETTSLVKLYEGVNHCRILKVDVEGAEWDCFKHVPDSVFDRTDYIVGELHMVSGLPHGTTPMDFLALMRGKFDDVSTEFGELGFRAATEQSGVGIFNFVLKRTGVQ